MAVCTFCGKNIEKGTGKRYITKDGKIQNYCSNKCQKNYLKLKRAPLKTKWTMTFQNTKKKQKKND